MNINPDRVKELVLLFSSLDDEYQMELISQAHILSLKQGQKRALQKEGKTFKNASEYKKEINKRSNEVAKQLINIIEGFKIIGDDEKAELLLLTDKLSGGRLGKKTDIEIKLNQRTVPIKDYIAEILPGVDFEAINKRMLNHLKEMKIDE